MTEKRFKLSKPNGAYLIDDDKVYAHWINDDDKIIDLLNSLAEENEELKQQVEDLEFKLRTIKAYDRTVKEEHSDSVYVFQKKLEKW